MPDVWSLTKSMARIYPFRALRYNPSMVRVEDVVTQPYDKISPAMQQAYYQRSVYNLVRIILGLPELFDEPGINDVYTRAARDFAGRAGVEWSQVRFDVVSVVMGERPEIEWFARAFGTRQTHDGH